MSQRQSQLPQPSATRRQGLVFSSSADIVADVEQLRRGYAKAGSWSLEQICWHLDAINRLRMTPCPFPPNTPEQIARRPVLSEIFATGKLPDNLSAPPSMAPPAEVGDSVFSKLAESLRQFDAYSGPFAPPRLLGHMSDADVRRLNLIHAAHHLSHLVPVSQACSPRY